MQLLPASEGFPYGTAKGVCYLCNGGPGGDGSNTVIIDFQLQIDMEGWVMLCEGCGNAIGNLLGMTSATETRRQLGRIRNLEDEILRLETEKEQQLNDVLGALRVG